MAKNLADKYGSLSAQMDNMINEANGEITGLRDKLFGTCIFTDLSYMNTDILSFPPRQEDTREQECRACRIL